MDVIQPIETIPCDLLLILARKLDPEDYLNLSSVSKSIRNCLKTGKYSQEQVADAKNFILEQKRKLIEMIEIVKKDPYKIKDFSNAPEKVKLAAVKKNGRVIGYIENPSEEVQLAAVKQSGYGIKYIENPSEEVQLAAVKQYGIVIEYIENPSEEVQLAAVKQTWRAITYIHNPSEDVKNRANISKMNYLAFKKASRPGKFL